MNNIQPINMNQSGNNHQSKTSVLANKKKAVQKSAGFINRNSLVTIAVLGTFAAALTGKILTAPKGYESEQWIDEN